ncbi:MAG: extracellular solute-binding protein [Anaerocolumna sp.]
MKKSMKKLFAVILVMVMVLSMTACGRTKEETGVGSETIQQSAGESTASGTDETKPAWDKEITLTVWNTEVPAAGIQDNEVAKAIEEKLGIKLDIVQGDAQKFSVLLAGGDLPDIIYTNPAQQGVDSNTLISSGQLLALDDLIAEYGSNIQENFASRLDYSKQFASNGENKIYYLPVLAYEADKENPDISYSIANVGLELRFDVYSAIGCPDIKTTDDFLNVLKQMQDYARDKDLADGKEIYAISGWSDWGLWPWYLANVREMGWDDLANDTLLNRETNEVETSYLTDSFWESLDFYRKAYNMGILDPEAFTMKNDQFWEKCNNGQVLMSYASWQSENINATFASSGHTDWGFEKIPFDGYKYISGVVSPDAPLGNGSEYANAITTNCKYPERAMQLLDYLNSGEGARLIYSGVEGVHWTNKDGDAQPTEDFIQKSNSDPNYLDSVGVTLYNKLCGFKDIAVLSDGYPANLMKSNEQKAMNLKDVDKAYCEYYSELYSQEFTFPGEVLNYLWQKGEVDTFADYILYTSLVQAPSDDTLNILAQCDQYMNVEGVKAIMAKTEEEFNTVKAEALEAMEAKGISDASAEIKSLYQAAKEQVSNFTIK